MKIIALVITANLVDIITNIIGKPPVGWEFVPYLIAAFLFFLGIWLVWKIVSIPLYFLRGR